MNRQDEPIAKRPENSGLYETRAGTWIAGAVAGVALAFGLVVAGDRYVRVAKGPAADDATAVARRIQPARVATNRDPFSVGSRCEFDVALCDRKCSAC